MQGSDNASAFIAGFAGTDRYVVDYLADDNLESPDEQTYVNALSDDMQKAQENGQPRDVS